MNRRTLLHVLAAAALLGPLGCRPARSAGLVDFVRKPDAEYSWTKVSEKAVGPVKVIELKMRSQVWRGLPWDHTVQIFLPQELKYPKTATLLITGGNPGPTELLLAATVTPRIQAPLVILYNIPNQPLFGGKSEDDLIAHTFSEYLKADDDTWPLLFPMTKSAVRAMDAVQALSKQEWPQQVEDFVVTGASKRGWTTWLTGASDPRVRAIAPMVFDNLNFAKQMPRQLELWGKYSAQIDDYTRRGLQQQLDTPKGKQLVSMVDPWFYRKQLTMPKLIINGANDPYWSTDSTRLYWDDLEGEKYLISLPNSGHGLDDRGRLLNSLVAFFHAVAGKKELPKLQQDVTEASGKIRLRVKSSQSPKEVRAWINRASDLDFRPTKWESLPMKADGDAWVIELDTPTTGGLAVFAEGEYSQDSRTFTLSTTTSVFGKKKD